MYQAVPANISASVFASVTIMGNRRRLLLPPLLAQLTGSDIHPHKILSVLTTHYLASALYSPLLMLDHSPCYALF